MVNNKKKQQRKKGGKAVKAAKAAKAANSRVNEPCGPLIDEKTVIRVSFEGLISLIHQSDNTIIECSEKCIRRTDGKPTFRESGLTATKLKLSGLWPGGSRDLSSVTPSRIYYPHPVSSAHARYDLASTTHHREWPSGSVQYISLNDKMVYIKALSVSPKYREVRDASFCSNIRMRVLTRGSVRGINYIGDVDEMLQRCKQMQNSFWALFYSRLWHIVNTLGMSSVDAYPTALGFQWSSFAEGEALSGNVAVGPMKLSRRLVESRRLILSMAAHLANVVRSVVEHTPCNLRPWQGMNVHYAEVHEISNSIEKLDKFVASCKLDSFLPNTLEFARTRIVWTKTMVEAASLHSLFLSGMAATAITQTMAIDSGFLNPTTVPVDQLRDRHVGNRELYGYTISANEYTRLIKQNSGPPSYAFMPFNNDAFTFSLKDGSESGYMSQHPLIFWTSIQFAEMQTCVDVETAAKMFRSMGHSVKAHSVASKTLLMNTFGPDRTTMRVCFDQAIAENNAFSIIDTTKRCTRLDPKSPGMIAIKVNRFIRQDNFDLGDFAQLFMRLLRRNDLAEYLTSTITMNPEWLIRSRYLHLDLRTPEHEILKRAVALQVLCKFFGGWAYSRRLHRARNATFIQSIARRWLARKRVQRRIAARIRAQAAVLRMNEAREEAKRRHRHTMHYLVWAQRRAIANFATKSQSATRISARVRTWLEKTAFTRQKRAATVLQCWTRKHSAHSKFATLSRAVVTLQRVARGGIARSNYAQIRGFLEKLRLAEEEAIEAKRRLLATVTLQRYCRGHQGRVRVAKAVAAHHEHFHRIYMDKVMKIAEQLRHFFFWNNLVSDQFMMHNRLPNGVVPFELLMSFPSISMYLCTIPQEYHLSTLVKASHCVPDVVVTVEGILHIGFVNHHHPSMVPVIEMVPVVKMVFLNN